MTDHRGTLRCVLLGCAYDDDHHCKRCGRENPRFSNAKANLSGRYD